MSQTRVTEMSQEGGGGGGGGGAIVTRLEYDEITTRRAHKTLNPKP